MKTYTLDIKNEKIIDKVLWMLNHFKDDGVIVREVDNVQIDVKTSIKQSINEINMIKEGKLKAKPVEDLLNAL